MVLARAFLLLALLTLALAAPAHADPFSDAQAALEQTAQQVGSSVGVPAKQTPRQQKSWTESTAQNGGVAAPTAPAQPTTAGPAPATSAEPAPAPAAAAPAPTAVAPAPANVNITIRVRSPGNDGPTIQQVVSGGISAADADRIEHDLQVQLNRKFKELQRQMSAPAPAPVQTMPVSHVVQAPVRHAPKPHAVHAARAVHQVAAPLRLPKVAPPLRPPPRHVQHRTHAQRAVHRDHAPFQQLPQPFPDQALSAGSSGGTSTPPPALFAVLLAAACFAASMLVTGLWDAHRRRRTRLFASRLERPG